MRVAASACLAADLGTLLALPPATSALAVASSLEVQPGTLESRGLVATVPVTFVCDEGADFVVVLTVTQVVQQKMVTIGGSSIFGKCTGDAQTVSLEIRSQPKPFKKGVAVADANIDTYCTDIAANSYYYCGSAYVTSEEIRFR